MLDRVCRELACTISRAVLLSRVQFVIMHVILLPVERKTLPTGWRSLMRSSAHDERSFIIHQVRPTVRVTDSVYRYLVLVYREKLDVSRREFRKVSFRLCKYTYARSLRGRVALHCLAFRDRIDILSLADDR